VDLPARDNLDRLEGRVADVPEQPLAPRGRPRRYDLQKADAFFGFWTALGNGDHGQADEMIECLATHATRLG